FGVKDRGPRKIAQPFCGVKETRYTSNAGILNSPFTIHHSLFTIHYSPFTIHHSLFTILH
ncbi:MAG: hypothetical protein PHQ29_03820, partial [Candidatus Cloacimonetes bacterium]|nr:hypothetical protein [Candidatus Cloacimonadota bacterium]